MVTEASKKTADSLFEAGRQLYYKREFDKSASTFRLADSIFKQQENFKRSLKSRINIATALQAKYFDNDSILAFLKKDASLVDKLPKEAIEGSEYYNKLHEVCYALGNYEDAQAYALRSYQRLQKIQAKDNEIFKATHLYTLRSLIINAQELHNFQYAEDIAKVAINFSKKHQYKEFSSQMDLFTTYVFADKFHQAEKQLNHIESENLVDTNDIFSTFDYYRFKIEFYTKTKKFKLAFKAANDLQKIIDKSGYKKHFSQWYLTQVKSDIFIATGMNQQAIAFIEALQIDPTYENATIEYRSADFLRLAKAHYSLMEFEPNHDNLWQKNIQKALNLHVPKEAKTNDFFQEVSFLNARKKDNLMSILLFKAKTCFEYYKKTNNREYLQIAIHSFQEAHKNLKLLGARSDEDAFIKAEEFDQFYNDLLFSFHDVWTQKKDSSVFYKALGISDESKNLFILNELKRVSEKKLFKNIPKEIREKEAQLQKQLIELNFLETTSKDSNKKEQIQQQLTNLQEELKTKYPKYYALKYNVETPIETIISRDLQNYNIISYTVTNEHIYIFNDNSGKLIFDKIRFDKTLQLDIDNYINSIQSFTDESYKDIMQNIFNKLLKPYLHTEKPTILVLDDILNAIPFDIFRECTTYNKPFLRLNNLRQTIESPQKNNIKTVVYAPFTKNFQDNFKWLPNSLKEANAVENVTQATLKTDENARKQTFIETAQNYDIIHLATHSKIDENIPLQSAIYFYGEPYQLPSSYTLKTKSLYDLSFSADLVTLSSCESGSGIYVSGKGVQSISNAFNYAGAKSTVMSLWEVPDKTTSEIMDLFYQNLKEGNDKATALQRAKEMYVAQTQDVNFKHPYFWASFVISGDITPMQLPQESYTNYYIGIAVLFLFVLFWILYKRKKQPTNHEY